MTRQTTATLLFTVLLALPSAACFTTRVIEHRPTPTDGSIEDARRELAEPTYILRILNDDWLSEQTALFGTQGKLTFDGDRPVLRADAVAHGSFCPFAFAIPIRPARWSVIEWGTGQYVSIPGDQLEVLESCAIPMTAGTRIEFGGHEGEAGRRIMDLMATLARATK